MPNNQPVDYTAEHYDDFTDRHVGPYDAIFLERIRQERGPDARLLLDVGAGTGRIPVKMAERSEFNGLTMVALEFFPDMVAAIRANLKHADLQHADLEQADLEQADFEQAGLASRICALAGDAHHLPFADDSFDLVISRSTLHHWADPAQAMKEVFRVLRPGGAAVIHDVRRDPSPEALAAFNKVRLEAGVGEARLEGKYTPDEARAMLAGAGLEQVSHVGTAEGGVSGLGYEVLIRKPLSSHAV